MYVSVSIYLSIYLSIVSIYLYIYTYTCIFIYHAFYYSALELQDINAHMLR